jgi:hypothetical protein
MRSRRVIAAVRLLTGVLAAVPMLAGGASSASAAPAPLDQELIYSAQDYGFAGATFDWTGPSSAGNIDLLVSDWGCDGKPVYAYFLFYDGALRPDSTHTHRYDYSGCDTGDYTSYDNLTWSISGTTLTYLGVVICRDASNGPCRVGALSDRNPYA